MESYVVRIYRFQRGRNRHVVGLVEAPRLSGTRAFTTVEQLWEILSEHALGKRVKLPSKSSGPLQ